MRIAFAGDRAIGVQVLDHLLDQGVRPEALLLSQTGSASHSAALRGRCPFLPDERVLAGKQFQTCGGIALLRELDLDFIVAVHFPYIISRSVLEIPRRGGINLHPGYLPYNRGWHTVSWAIMENTPIGATLHFLSDEVDAGDIIHRERVEISPGDTADSLYQKVQRAELKVFMKGWSALVAGSARRRPQDPNEGTAHRRHELLQDETRRLKLDETMRTEELLRRLRALSTRRPDEMAFYEVEGRRFLVEVRISEAPPSS